MEIFKLFGSIFIDNDKANKSLDDTDKKGQGVAKTLGNLVGTAAKVGAGIAAGAVAAGGAMFAMANKASEAASAINDMSVRTGLSTTQLQELKFAAEQTGVNFESITNASARLTNVMADAANGSKTAMAAFDKLDISITNSDGSLRSMDSTFPEVIKKLANMTNESERNALAFDLFGKGAVELVPLLAQGESGIDELTKKAHDLGLVMSEEAIQAGDTFGDTLDALKASVGAVGMQLGISFMPILQKLMDWIMAHMPEIKAIFETVFGVINTVVMKAFEIFNDNIKPVLISLYDWVQSNMPTFKAIFDTVFGTIWDIVSQVWKIFNDNLLPILKALYDFIKPTFPTIGNIIEAAFNTVIGIVQTAVDIFDKLTSGIKIAIDWLKKFNGTKVDSKDIPGTVADRYSHYANGTDNAPGGWAVVGEKGPELMYVPKHSKIIPNDEIESIGGTQEITVHIPVTLEGKTVTNIVSKIQLDNTRGRARAIGVSV